MKKAGAYAASLAAASSAALTALNNSDHGASSSPSSVKEGSGSGSGSSIDKDATGSVVEDKFAPRFDGLRFIETLVTAHR
ncbi:unnamed protein product [Musa acuminata subsp. malaccensis]|uniref:(wild Malaysian banana) hypothetical protein n=1 Tax=Musa acuminata subsp. malaccensis TaxID=214687 RepID=A0A804IWD8_MUSAM|nr:PREDICTED: uncharacterized protein LOC103982711 [Musa acuminata subsp. malaccensis]CAG1844028.1 unnamed protein product [Musa acuminata subsp. malaccensis]